MTGRNTRRWAARRPELVLIEARGIERGVRFPAAHVLQDLPRGRAFLDAGDDPPKAVAVRAGKDANLKHALGKVGPVEPAGPAQYISEEAQSGVGKMCLRHSGGFRAAEPFTTP